MRFEYKDGNPFQMIGIHYKEDLKRRSTAVEYEEYKKMAGGTSIAVTVKMDGEFAVPVLEDGKPGKVYSPGKKAAIRYDFEACREFEDTLKRKGHISGVFYAELYGAYPDGKPMKFNKVASLIAELHGKHTDKELRIGIFDVESLDGKKVDEKDYWKRYELIHSIFGGNTFCHPVVATQLGGLELFEKYVNSEGFEGLVVRTSSKVLKVKNLFTVDFVIYAVEKKGERMKMSPPRFGSVRIGLFLPSGDLVDMGSVGNGWDDDERLELHKELMKDVFFEDSAMFYVKPKHILEVGYTEMMMAKPSPNFGPIKPDGTFNPRPGKKSDAFSPRFPKRIPYIRPDGRRGDYPMISDHPKSANESDIGIRQVPEMAELYGIDGPEPKTLSARGSAELSEAPIKTPVETAVEVHKPKDVLKALSIERVDVPIYKFITDEGVSMKELMLGSRLSLTDIQGQLEELTKDGSIEKIDGKYKKKKTF